MRSWVLRRADACARACIVTALFVVPLIFIPTTLDQFSLVKLATLWFLGVCALGFWVLSATERRSWLPHARVITAMALFVAVSALGTAASELPQVAVIGLYSRYGGLVPLVLYTGLAVAVIGLFWQRPERLQMLVWAPVAASPFVAAFVIAQARGADIVDWGLNQRENARIAARLAEYPIGTLGNSNFAGGYLGIVAPLLVYAILQARRPLLRAALVVVAGADGLALWYSRSRGGLLAAGAGLLVVAVLWGSWRRAALRFWAAILAIVVVVSSVAIFSDRFDSNDRSGATNALLRSDTLVSRSWYWQSALEIVSDHPVLGTGPDTFYAYYPSHRKAKDGAQFGLVLADEPHNIVLAHAAGIGILGVASYMVLIGLVLVGALRRVPRADQRERRLLVTFLGMFVAYLAQGMFSIDVPPLAFAGWIAVAAVTVLSDPVIVRARRREARRRDDLEVPADTRRARRFSRRRSRWPLHVAVAVVALPLALAGAVPVVADFAARAAVARVRNQPGTTATAERDAQRAIDLDRREGAYRAVAGDVAEQGALATADPAEKARLLQQAVMRYRQALRMRPGHIYYMINVARVLTTLATDVDPAQFPAADRAWSRVVRFDRTDWEVHSTYAAMLNAWANAQSGRQDVRRRVAGELEAVVQIRPDRVEAWTNLARVVLVLGDTARAQSAAERALALAPGNPDATAVLDAARRG